MSLLSTQYCPFYYDDVLTTFFEVEKFRIHCFKRSPELYLRSELVDFIKKQCKRYNFNKLTLHLAVYTLDIFMDNYLVSKSQDHRHLMACVITFLAAKCEDLDENIPVIKEMMDYLDLSDIIDTRAVISFNKNPDPEKQASMKYELRKLSAFYQKLEYAVFETMKFNMIRPTVASFMEIYSLHLVTPDDYENQELDFESFADMKFVASNFMNEYLECTLESIDFVNVAPSVMAAVVVGATRNSLRLKQQWNQRLTNLTSYLHSDLMSLIVTLIQLRLDLLTESGEMMESGYSSDLNVSDSDSHGSGVSIYGSQSSSSQNHYAKRIKLE